MKPKRASGACRCRRSKRLAALGSANSRPPMFAQATAATKQQPYAITAKISGKAAAAASAAVAASVTAKSRMKGHRGYGSEVHRRCLPGRRCLGPTIRKLASNRSGGMQIELPSMGPHCLDAMDLIKAASRVHSWHWNEGDKSHECLVSDDKLNVCFHPECSESAAAIRGSKPLVRNGNYYYWEVTVFEKTYGTSVMFGLCTKQQPLHANDYCNLVGLDRNGWSLSHKGLIWHNGKNTQYTKMFPSNQTITIGLLFNTMRGELSYFMDGKNLGVAFCGLNDVNGELYPVIGSTAKCTRMRLTGAYCGYVSLMERSCFTLLSNAPDRAKLIANLKHQRVPINLIRYLAEIAEVSRPI